MSVLRSLERNRIRVRMKKEGMTRICSKRGHNGVSWFSAVWKDYRRK